ncbi:MAG TPA: acylphosphatase [Rhodospirillales bacterium]|jgi:acylphosphatase|nr:acylphosphatase [Rhodospirillales bacterium]HIL76288.1 acylphosphatase [Rhodospirillales bacterium]
MSKLSVRVIIEGRVQGVWFRGWMVERAMGLGLSGWVRNRREGSVEAVFYGEQNKVNKMIEKSYQGPSAASVARVSVKYEQIIVQPSFKQLPTV